MKIIGISFLIAILLVQYAITIQSEGFKKKISTAFKKQKKVTPDLKNPTIVALKFKEEMASLQSQIAYINSTMEQTVAVGNNAHKSAEITIANTKKLATATSKTPKKILLLNDTMYTQASTSATNTTGLLEAMHMELEYLQLDIQAALKTARAVCKIK